MERGAITYSASYLAGIYASFLFGIPFPVTLALLATLAATSYITRKRPVMFLAASHIALFIAGAGAAAIASDSNELPESRLRTCITAQSSRLRSIATGHLATIVPRGEEHATLCALAIGEKGLMERELKQDFSEAGAMHVLALSGLHIGIFFAIIYKGLSFLSLIPWGNNIRNIIAVVFIFIYAIFTGGSPSVIRAAFMILIYKISGMSFRQIGKWDSIALSAMVIGIISPAATKSIGFQLSYAAVIGITLLYPTCKAAYGKIFPSGKEKKGLIRIGAAIWDSVSISVCCQITTLPFVIYYFGKIPQWFLLSNIVVVPAATAILHLAILAIVTQPIPFLGEFSAEMLACAIAFLNKSVRYISN